MLFDVQGEQEEYVREGIQWSYVDFVDNQECLDLLEGSAASPSLAVFPLIDEANRMARSTYQVPRPLCPSCPFIGFQKRTIVF